jgi:hypothetical protein
MLCRGRGRQVRVGSRVVWASCMFANTTELPADRQVGPAEEDFERKEKSGWGVSSAVRMAAIACITTCMGIVVLVLVVGMKVNAPICQDILSRPATAPSLSHLHPALIGCLT